MSKKVLIRKQAGGVQQFQTIGGGGGPSFMDLARRTRDPTASGWQKIMAGLGMAGKTAAGIGAANQTLQQMHGGNAFAPLNLGYTYQGLDPTTGMQATVTPGEQQDADIRGRLQGGAEDDVIAATDMGIDLRQAARGNARLPPPAGLPAETPDSPSPTTYNAAQLSGAPGSAQRAWRESGGRGIAPPGYRPPVAQPPVAQPPVAQPPQLHPLHPSLSPGGSQGPPVPAAPLNNELVQVTANTSVPTAAPATAATAAPATAIPNPGYPVDGEDAQQQASLNQYPSFAPNTGPNPPPLPSTPAPGYTPPVAIQPYQHSGFENIPGTPGNVNTQPRQDPGVDHQNLTIDGIRFGSQTAFDMALQRRMNRSFATQVLDQFGDMLHKADPHVAGLLAFRVYMDKVMR
tara:strand:- start:13871 stop:15076 length:1206 start_codon:yes stop_codon:yes gene_type:complete